ncbi:MAG: MBL fold metallo-hydrolase [Bdellovibrionota bacterium]
MAQQKKRLSYNVEGPCFVDSTCIDCASCHWIAPDIFGDRDGTYYVKKNPETPQDLERFQMSLLSCPTNSIGDQAKRSIRKAMDALPHLLEEDVYFCGFTSHRSFGAQSYFIKHQDGNWLVDSPKMTPYLVERFKELGGLKYIFITHQDNVADAFHYAEIFKSSVIMHIKDAGAGLKIDICIKKDARTEMGPFAIIPTPGHTQGSLCLLYKEKFLFTGDHLYFENGLNVFSEYCWFDFEEQILSVEKLRKFTEVEWILPGHGGKKKIERGTFSHAIDQMITMIKSTYK